MIRVNLRGRNRFVLLVGRYALKFPSFRNWRDFLFGLLNNLNERDAYRRDPAHRCPVLFAAPGGFLLIMPRVRTLTDEEMAAVDAALWAQRSHAPEAKPDSFGWHENTIVAVDYGW